MRELFKKVPLARPTVQYVRAIRRRSEPSTPVPGADAAMIDARATAVVDARATAMVDARATARAEDASTEQAVAIARAEWRDQGATGFLVDRARALSTNSVAWGALPPRAWLVLCAVLLEAGDTEAADRLLRTWVGRRAGRVDLLAVCLPVARRARALGLVSGPVSRVADAADVLEANGAADVFGALVAGKTVAVVGNGPGNIGSGRGPEIDAHDLVVRFNNFPAGYEDDYGHRTDIWVRGAHRDVRDRPEIEGFALVVWEMDLFRNLLEVRSHAEILARDTSFSPDRVTHVDTATKRALREASGLLLPTSGAQLLWMLHSRRGSLRDVDVYGFSTLDGGADFGHYFDALGDMGSRHDVDREAAFLRALLDEGRRPGGDVDAPVAPVRAGEVTVFGCAYRQYDPTTGKTGGPGGVLATQRLALGDAYRGQELAYLFQDGSRAPLKKSLGVALQGLRGKVSDIVLAGEFVRTSPEIAAARAGGRQVLLVCHELGSAYGAYLLGVPYVLVYHQQGSTLQEMRSIGQRPSRHETHVADRLERLVCENARKVYFPSLGAGVTYRETSLVDTQGVTIADTALYNTVSAVDHATVDVERGLLLAEVLDELGLPLHDDETDVFVSVGDFNRDKGLDQVPALLERHVAVSGRRVVWVAVGAASDPRLVASLEQARPTWSFTARLVSRRMTHDRLLALLDHADYYVMLHRNAIFDLATLEAMRAGKPLLLSPVGGNLEVDLDGNVLFVTSGTLDDACRVLETRDRVAWGERNRRVFEEHFTLESFAARYRAMLDEHLDALLVRDEIRAVAGGVA